MAQVRPWLHNCIHVSTSTFMALNRSVAVAEVLENFVWYHFLACSWSTAQYLMSVFWFFAFFLLCLQGNGVHTVQSFV